MLQARTPSSLQRVAKLVFQRLHEDFVQKPDYALSSVGRRRGSKRTGTGMRRP